VKHPELLLAGVSHQEEEEISPEEEIEEQDNTRAYGYNTMMVPFDPPTYRALLTRLVVHLQLPFAVVKKAEFRDLVMYLQPLSERYLAQSPATIKSMVIDTYERARVALKAVIGQARSRVHISIDIWTSPPGIPILGICAHFLTSELQLKHAVIGLKFLPGHHTGEAQAAIVKKVMDEYEITQRWGVLVADNADNNDTACKVLVAEIYPGGSSESRRSRCFGHIINLASQAFIYGKQHESFVTEAD
jgi:hypothetical protein